MEMKRYLMWPIKLKWVKPLPNQNSKWFKKHGWQVGFDGFAMSVYGWTYHLGRLKICFGSKDFKKKPHKQNLYVSKESR